MAISIRLSIPRFYSLHLGYRGRSQRAHSLTNHSTNLPAAVAAAAAAALNSRHFRASVFQESVENVSGLICPTMNAHCANQARKET